MKNRLLSLDVMRGITIAGMLLVNNPGAWGHIYPPLRHASWNGLTPTDLVFPFFMYIMGMSAYFSLKKYDNLVSWPVIYKILKRTVILFAIGIGLVLLARMISGVGKGELAWSSVFDFSNIRILGVIPRLAICYGAGSLIAVFSGRFLKWLIVAILILYGVILLLGNGFEFSENNIIAVVDRYVLGEAHMYTSNIDGVRMKFDPEGFLSTLPSIAHMLIGYQCGKVLLTSNDNGQRITKLMIIGTCLTFAGFLLAYCMPLNKKVWSPTFVLTTCGLACQLLGLLLYIIDVRGWKKWCPFFRDFGVNPLFMYVLGSVFSSIFGSMRIADSSWKAYYYDFVLTPLCMGDQTLASLLYAVTFVCLVWIFAHILYKRKIYIKI
ncbi:MAG: DUF5009 domain-containing protein [Muribaculaceae bacterium]|nr:DUF5009 domain-containing protein [Muribaculaceae bacterium]